MRLQGKAAAMTRATLLGLPLAFLFPSASQASSGDAWAEFRQETGRRCIAELRRTEGLGRSVQVSSTISDHGSESFGAALLRVGSGQARTSYICIMNKRTTSVEIAALP